MERWDAYFLNVCNAVATKSPCLSRKIGALLVRDKSIVSTGYNGPPRGIPHCGANRLYRDAELMEELVKRGKHKRGDPFPAEWFTTCPRKILGYESGEGMEWCTAQHAEENAVSNAAKNGVSTDGCTLYLNTCFPCNKCFGTLINARIVEIVVTDLTPYDIHTKFLIAHSSIKVRRFRGIEENP